MGIQAAIGRSARWIDQRFGLLAWLNGEPRPPIGGFDLDGEKLLDWGWICANLPAGPKRALEIGSGKSPVVPAMLARGYTVFAVDQSFDLSSLIDGFSFIKGDFCKIEFDQTFDVIVLCSVVEHVGLSGRYNSGDDADGDLVAMRKVRSLLGQGGLVFLTVPLGHDAVYRPWHRVYGVSRLGRLIEGFEVQQARFLKKQPGACWHETTESEVMSAAPDVRRYALGQFILRVAQ